MAIIQPQTYLSRSGNEILIRSLQNGDETIYPNYISQIAKETTHTLKYEGMELATAEKLLGAWKHYADHPINLLIGAFHNDRLVGNIKFFQKSETHPWIQHIAAFGMSVQKEYWGQGIGKKLLDLITDHASKFGIKRIEAEVRTENEPGVLLYTKAGFKIEGKREKCAFIQGQYVDEYYIAKLL